MPHKVDVPHTACALPVLDWSLPSFQVDSSARSSCECNTGLRRLLRGIEPVRKLLCGVKEGAEGLGLKGLALILKLKAGAFADRLEPEFALEVMCEGGGWDWVLAIGREEEWAVVLPPRRNVNQHV